MKPNIVIVHDGDHDYLKIALEQAGRWGNTALRVGMDSVSDLWPRFESAYRHMSTNPVRFELLCFRRHFVLQRIFHETDIQSLFAVDSDVLVYENLHHFEEAYLKPANIACATLMPKSQPAWRFSYGCQTSYWTKSSIDDFCAFMISSYEEAFPPLFDKWDWHVREGRPGGVCDMTLLYLWAQKHHGIFDLAKPTDGAVFDLDINAAENSDPDEYDTVFSKKRVKFLNGLPHVRRKDDQANIRFRTLHFQGPAKSQMARFATGQTYGYDFLLRPWLHEKIKKNLFRNRR